MSESTLLIDSATVAQDGGCFHCGLRVPEGCHFTVLINQRHESMCCPGCQAVATMIVANKLEGYYRFRQQKAVSQYKTYTAEIEELLNYDDPQIQATLPITTYEKTSDHRYYQEINLHVQGITCAACVWLIEKGVSKLTGLRQISVNLSTHKATVAWEPEYIALSQILQAVHQLGYEATPYHPEKILELRNQDERAALKRLAVSGLGFGQVMMLSAPLYGWFTEAIPEKYRDFFRLMNIVVTTPILFYCGLPFFKRAYHGLKQRYCSMDMPVSLALFGIYFAGLYAYYAHTGELYFDSITMLLFFLSLARYLEMRVRHSANQLSEQLSTLSPHWVIKIINDKQEPISTQKIAPGDCLFIKSGETIPVDGVVVKGNSCVNESLLTGEAVPKFKTIHDKVIAGTQNIEHPLTIRAERVGDHTTLAAILRLHERAQQDKPKILSITNQAAHYFVLILLVVATLAAGFWYPRSPEQAFWVTISILVVTCPCAFSLAAPVAMTASMNALLRAGFLCARSHVLETLPSVTDIIFDKTGTLTSGNFSIVQVQALGRLDQPQVLNIAASLEQHSAHPLAQAFKQVAATYTMENVVISPSLGLSGQHNDDHYFLGNLQYIHPLHPQYQPKIDEKRVNETTIYLADSKELLAEIVLSNALRAEVPSMVTSLQRLGFRLHIASGDLIATTERLANTLGIRDFLGEATATRKLEYVRELQDQGAIVLMVGDGINDAPVLAQAQVSIAMGSGADLTRLHADAILLHNELSMLPRLLNKARLTQRIIIENLIWAGVYNMIMLPLAVCGLIAPYVAAIGMSISSLIVVVNSLRLSKRG